MILKDQDGRDVELYVSGRYEDDITIDEIYYLDSSDDVSDETIDYIYDTYAEEIYQCWYEKQIGAAEDRWEGER